MVSSGDSIKIVSMRKMNIQSSPFKMLYLGSIGMDHVISESYYTGVILQRNYRKMTMLWSFSYNSFVKFHGKNIPIITL